MAIYETLFRFAQDRRRVLPSKASNITCTCPVARSEKLLKQGQAAR
jgi:hypothetical protein